MAIRPTKFLIVNFALGSATATIPSGQWTGYPYQWNATLSVNVQPHGSDETTPQFYYDGTNVKVGDCIATGGQGRILRIVSITSQDAGTVNCVVEDVNYENVYQDVTQSGDGAITDGEGYLFEVVDGIPVLHPLPDALAGAIPPYFSANIMMRFFGNKAHSNIEVIQISHGLSVGDAIYLTSSGSYAKAQSNNPSTSLVIGVVTNATLGTNVFRYRPTGPLVSGITMPAGNPGDIVYLSEVTAGGLTTIAPSNPVPIFIKISATSAVLYSGSGSSGGGGGLEWKIISVNTGALDGNGYLIDASSAPVILTLPAIPTIGMQVGVKALNLTYAITVARSGSKIEGYSTDLTIDVNHSGFTLVYSGASLGWVIVTEINGGGSSAEVATPTGVVQDYVGTTAPNGWIMLTGASAVRTLGSPSSGADYAADDAVALYTLFWNSMADAQAPVTGGRGASAAADFVANKTLTVPEYRGRSVVGTGTGTGLTARIHGDTGGAETHQLSEGELASHAHTTYYGSGAQVGSGAANVTFSGTTTGTTATGLDQPHNNMQPWVAMNKIVKL